VAQPIPFVPVFSFADFATANPADPLPGDQVDIFQFLVQQTLQGVLANLALIQNDGGGLATASVGIDQLKTEVTLGFNAISNWAPGIDYALNNGVWFNSAVYRCAIAHTSTVFATDLAAGRWEVIVDFNQVITDAGNTATAASAQAIASAAAALASQNSAAGSATSAGTSATNAASALASVVTLYDNFDDRYLGSKAVAPTLDNDGAALLTGALYWDTALVRMRVYTGSAWTDLTTAVNAKTFVYTATAAQTTFTGADLTAQVLAYTPGNIEVFVQGLRRSPSTYTASNGTSVVFGAGLNASDQVIISSFSSFTLNAASVMHQAALSAQFYG
jgi:hypothetical protein